MPWRESERDGAVARAARILREGGVVAHPTETVYGLAAAADDERGYRELLRLKGGSSPRAFLLLFAERFELERRLGPLPSGAAELARAFWPGPLTLLVPARADLPVWWSGAEGEVAARVTSHAFARALVEELGGPVLSTSANPASTETPATAGGVARAFVGRGLPLVVDGGRLEGSPSTLLRWGERGWSVVREGPLAPDAIADALSAGAGWTRAGGNGRDP